MQSHKINLGNMSVSPGGLILLTGANGYLASVTISLFLQHGYSVRGTVRSIAAHAWMSEYFGPRFELVEVPNIYAPDAWDTPGLLDGVQGIAHMAMDTSMDPGNHAIIENTVTSTLALLEAAAKTTSVRSVVITSSLAACALTDDRGAIQNRRRDLEHRRHHANLHPRLPGRAQRRQNQGSLARHKTLRCIQSPLRTSLLQLDPSTRTGTIQFQHRRAQRKFRHRNISAQYGLSQYRGCFGCSREGLCSCAINPASAMVR